MKATSRTLREKLGERWAGLRTGHEAVMMEDARSVLADERAKTNRVDPSKPLEREQMGNLHVGDVYHEAAKSAPVGTLAKLALGGALLASGVGAGYGGAMLAEALVAQSPPAVEQPEQIDHDTRYRLEFGTPVTKTK